MDKKVDVIQKWIKYINYPLALRVSGNQPRGAFYNECIKKQYRPMKENIREQREHLYEIVMYAVEHVPYYRDIVKERNLSFTKESIAEEIKQLPILTKGIIRREGSRLLSEEKIDNYMETSGGVHW